MADMPTSLPQPSLGKPPICFPTPWINLHFLEFYIHRPIQQRLFSMFGVSIQCNYLEVRHVVGSINNLLLFTNTFFIHTREENKDGEAAPNRKDDGRAGPQPGPSLFPGPLSTHFTRGFENLLTQVELHSFPFKSLLPVSLRQEHRAMPKASAFQVAP